jgi:hypothetical protein
MSACLDNGGSHGSIEPRLPLALTIVRSSVVSDENLEVYRREGTFISRPFNAPSRVCLLERTGHRRVSREGTINA